MTVFRGTTPTGFGYQGTYWDLIEDGCARWADHVLLADDYGRSLAGTDLRDATLRAAAALQERGIRRGSHVSWQLPTSIETMVVLLALARLGAVQNPIIPMLRERDVAFIIDQLQSEFLLVPESYRGFDHGDMARSLASSGNLEVVICDHETDPASMDGALRLPDGDPGTLAPPPDDPDEVRWVFYSSGTTADPKGVQHSDRTIVASVAGVIGEQGANAQDINPMAFPISHAGGATMMASSLVSGMQLLLFDTFDPVETPHRMAARNVTLLGSALPFYVAFLDAQARQDEPLFPHLRCCAGGGAPMPPAVNEAVRKVFGVGGIINGWGLTEFPVATFPTPDDPPDWIDNTVGRPVGGVEVRVVGDDEQELEAGEEGELRLRGPQCFLGYVDSRLDAEAFDADGWFRTGDLGLVDENGNVRITGRLKDVIIRNAENISALEIEAALFEHPDVADGAVIGTPDPRTGEQVCAVVVARPGASVTLDDLRRHCIDRGLPRQKVPERLELVEQLPRNVFGKVLKKELRARFNR